MPPLRRAPRTAPGLAPPPRRRRVHALRLRRLGRLRRARRARSRFASAAPTRRAPRSPRRVVLDWSVTRGRRWPAPRSSFDASVRLVAGVVRDRLERVQFAVAVPRVVARPALALLDGAAVEARDVEVVDARDERRVGELGRTRLRICRLVEIRLDLLGPHLPVLRAVRLTKAADDQCRHSCRVWRGHRRALRIAIQRGWNAYLLALERGRAALRGERSRPRRQDEGGRAGRVPEEE